MFNDIDRRSCDIAVYIIESNGTVRTAAKHFGISKSTVHKDMTERLPRVNAALYGEVRKVLDKNKAERHIRGGLATKRKFQESKVTGDIFGKSRAREAIPRS